MARVVLLLVGIFTGYLGRGQCGFTAVLGTSRDHCIGSSLLVKTTHALQKIVWYKDGAAVLTTTGTSNFDKNYRVAAGGNGQGTNENQLTDPTSVFVDEGGNIFVSDGSANRVQKWAPGAPAGVTVAGGNGSGQDADELNTPKAIYLDKSGNIYIADWGNHRVQKWAPGASAGVTVAGGNGPGPGADQLHFPSGVFVDCDGNVYVADGFNSRIQKWPPGATAGVTLTQSVTGSPTVSYTAQPNWVAFDGASNMYVGSEGDGDISRWSPDLSSATLLANTFPFIICTVTKGGDVYAVFWPGDSVLELAHGASSWQTIVSARYLPQSSFTDPNYGFPCLDKRGNLYLPDGFYSRVLEFDRTVNIDSTYTPAATGSYMAMVIDIRGDTAWTEPEVVNVPFSGPVPSVQISASATTVDLCQPVDFTGTAVNAGFAPVYQWQVSGVDVGSNTLSYSHDLFANGDRVMCILTTDTGCSATPFSDTSNIIMLTVNSQSYATVAIAASDTAVCAGTPIDFTATVTNPISPESYEWSVNGSPIAGNSPTWVDSNAVGGQVVYCVIASNSACGLSKSNSVPVTIYPLPTIAAGQVFSVPYGKSLQLDPVVTGDISDYAWSPATGLSDATIRNPVAEPSSTTLYTLLVTSFGGCKASGTVTLDVYTPLQLPNAFTPNGDGHNDVLYVLGGPEGSLIKDFAVFSRWGQPVFAVHDAAPGDPRFGWNGYLHGAPAPADTYVYMIVMQYANGSRQNYKGTVVLVR